MNKILIATGLMAMIPLLFGVAAWAEMSPEEKAAHAADTLDGILARLNRDPKVAPEFYQALLAGDLFAFAQEVDSKPVLKVESVKGTDTIYLYTSEHQMTHDPTVLGKNYVRMNGRKMLELVAGMKCNAGINAFSDHGGLLEEAKIRRLLNAEPGPAGKG